MATSVRMLMIFAAIAIIGGIVALIVALTLGKKNNSAAPPRHGRLLL